MLRPRLVITILAIGPLAFSAYGSESSPAATSSDSQGAATGALEASIAETLVAIDEEGAITFTNLQATCLSQRVVASIGADRLIELGADTGEDLTSLAWTADERTVVFDDLQSCVDVEAQLAALFATDPSITAEVATCLAASYAASDVLPDALFSTGPNLDIDQRVDEALNAAYGECS